MELSDSVLDLENLLVRSGLIDLELEGSQFTWQNKRMGENLIQVRLDSFLVLTNWDIIKQCKLSSLLIIGSDYTLLLLNLHSSDPKAPYCFRFEIMWTHHVDLKILLKSWWDIEVQGTAMFRIVHKHKIIKRKLKVWNRNSFGNIFT